MATQNPPPPDRVPIEAPRVPTRDTSELARELREPESRTALPVDPRRGWGVALAIGILMVLAGAFALYASVLTSLISVLFLGITLIVVGIFEMISAFRLRRREPFLVYFLVGLLSLVIGALFVARPLVGLATLTFVIACFMFASGLFRAVVAVTERYPHWGWDLLYAFVAIALGVYIIAAWPISALWLLGMLVAIDIIVRGATLIAASWLVRDIERGERPRLAHA